MIVGSIRDVIISIINVYAPNEGKKTFFIQTASAKR